MVLDRIEPLFGESNLKVVPIQTGETLGCEVLENLIHLAGGELTEGTDLVVTQGSSFPLS